MRIQPLGHEVLMADGLVHFAKCGVAVVSLVTDLTPFALQLPSTVIKLTLFWLTLRFLSLYSCMLTPVKHLWDVLVSELSGASLTDYWYC